MLAIYLLELILYSFKIIPDFFMGLSTHLHNVCEMNVDAYLDPKYGIYDYLMEQKKNGRIRHLGF